MRVKEQIQKKLENDFKIDLAYEECLKDFIAKADTSINNPNYLPIKGA